MYIYGYYILHIHILYYADYYYITYIWIIRYKYEYCITYTDNIYYYATRTMRSARMNGSRCGQTVLTRF